MQGATAPSHSSNAFVVAFPACLHTDHICLGGIAQGHHCMQARLIFQSLSMDTPAALEAVAQAASSCAYGGLASASCA